MNHSKLLSLVLLGYLAFFLNLGPSFHRAPIFGLHDHDHQVADVKCSCGRDHGPAESQDVPDESDWAIEKQLCDCSLCKFFKQFNAAVDADILALNSHAIPQLTPRISSLISESAIQNLARGPPVV